MPDNINKKRAEEVTKGRYGSPLKNSTSEKNYFEALADKYSKASHILYIALVVIFVFTLLFNAKLFTYNNFNYLIRDLNSAAEIASENYNSISYTNDPLRVSENFRGGVITVSTGDMAIYTATGKKTLHVNENFVSPEISASQKYAIVYDLGGTKYSVYTSFARVYGGKTTYPISLVETADNGWYAIVSRDNDHTSVIYLYDNDFKLRTTYYFASKYVFDVSINERGNRIAILTAEAALSGEEIITSVRICEIGSDNVKTEARLGAGMPYGCVFTDDDTLQMISSDGLYMLDENSENAERLFDIEEKNAYRVSITPSGSAIALSDNKGTVNNMVFVFDKNGNMIYNNEIQNSILDMEYADGCLFVNQNDSILKINVKTGKRSEAPNYEKGTDIIVYNSNNILLCCQTKAKYINF